MSESTPSATTVAVLTPVPGDVIGLADVPDPVFSAAMVGPGVAVDPSRDGPVVAVAPVDGRVVKLHAHAYVVTTPAGAGVLVHLGLDTVQLKGEGFELHVAEGDDVRAGTPIVTWDPAAVAAGGRSPVVPVIALDAEAAELAGVREPGPIAVGDQLFAWTR